ncbi:MAG: alpha-(1-_3)-arabinofuranosyltransferase domain-containing protein, partial [Microthrixaceae bacterium]
MRLRSKTELVALAALAYGPFLASSPGRVSADSKQDLYLDPGRFLGRVTDLWDPHIGAGTVPHQNLGYLFPAAPWFWVMERAGVPDWVAQRLWLGTLSLLAALGARWLFRQLGTGRTGAMAGALVYLLTPYQLAFTARMSVLLLPWAALPWLVGCTMRATRTHDWRAPALLGIVLVFAGGINASSLVFVALGPLLWVVLDAAGGPMQARRALAGAVRLALVGVGVSIWWAVGVRVQGSHGLPVLQLTEGARTVAELSTPADLLRGMGNWFFYGRDRTGYSLDQAADYGGASDLVVVLSYGVPLAGLAAAFVLRWAHRAYFALLVVVGTVVGVGAWPYDDPTPFGALWKTFTSETSVGLALRNTPRAAPLVVLGFAGLLAGVVGSVPMPQWRRLGAGAVAFLAVAGLLPVWQQGFLTDGMQRPEEIPDYWHAAARAMDAGDEHTRVLEIPGSSFAAYRWGTTVDPITPGLIDRPYLAREVLPSGGAGTANVLDALDRRMQQGTFEARSLAPIARLLGVGTVVLRADLERAGRFDTPEPAPLWSALRRGLGLAPPSRFGPTGVSPTDPTVPAVALFEVVRPRATVRTAPVTEPVVVAGDGDGLVDAAAAGLLDGTALVMEAAALDDAQLDRALRTGAHLVVTDTNRRRAQTWFYTLRDSRGETERAGRTAPDPTGYDFRLDPFPGSDDDDRTVVEQVGGTVEVTAGGGPERPEDRGAHAVDGDATTAWRVGGIDPRGARITITPAAPVPTSTVFLQQPPVPPGGRSLARVRLQVGTKAPMDIDLDTSSFSAPGQAVAVPGGVVEQLRVTLVETAPAAPGHRDANPVGLAEVRIGDLTVDEVVRPPIDLLERVGGAAREHGLDVVLTRLRVNLPGTDRADDETHLDRRLALPVARSFGLSGVARPRAGVAAPPASDGVCRSDLLTLDGAPVPVRLTSDPDGWAISGCAPVDLDVGSHRLVAAPGSTTGVDVDRLVLSSDTTGSPASVSPRGAPAQRGGAAVRVVRDGPARRGLQVVTDGEPFWLVLAESSNAGWTAQVGGATVGERQLVDGYAN